MFPQLTTFATFVLLVATPNALQVPVGIDIFLGIFTTGRSVLQALSPALRLRSGGG